MNMNLPPLFTIKAKIGKGRRPTNPAPRKAKGFYFRHYVGGEFDGLKEQYPIFVGSKLKPEINKEEWRSGRFGMVAFPNRYKLMEPATKPQIGATYIYEAV